MELLEIKGGGLEPRYYIDGKRVSVQKFQDVDTLGTCYRTKCKDISGKGAFRRWNYKTV